MEIIITSKKIDVRFNINDTRCRIQIKGLSRRKAVVIPHLT
ncbi:MAG: hypothetical protein V3R54_07725 [Thermodesulfovibrionia bacterium]